MKLQPESIRLDDYLIEAEEVNFSHPAIQEKSASLISTAMTVLAKVRALFEFVRDNIAHSWDIQNHLVTRKASDVLAHWVGICYAKSNLLASMLRLNGIPAGFCYQKLTLGDTPDTGEPAIRPNNRT